MDFMKVLDQTVRDIKREVNLRLLKVPEIEQKVLDATSDEPWGPHGSDLLEIAEATKKYTECEMIMTVLWQRLGGSGGNWRHVYKALAVIEYLIANGSERAVDDILENISQISGFTRFEHVEPNGKDVGMTVRKKVETILHTLDDKEKLQQVREKAAANHDKYFGLSSTGITYKSSSPSFGSTGYKSTDRYGGLSSSREADSFRDSYTDTEQDIKDIKSGYSNRDSQKPKGANSITAKGQTHKDRDQESLQSNSTKPSSIPACGPSVYQSSQTQTSEDDFDDFDPRGSSNVGSAKTAANQVDLFGESLIDGLDDTPASASTMAKSFSSSPATPDTDLFADATFQSATPLAGAAISGHSQSNVDLFASQSAFSAPFSSNGFSVASNPSSFSREKPPVSEQASSNTFDPFAAIPLNSYEGSDSFAALHSNMKPTSTESLEIKTAPDEVTFGDFTSHIEPATSDPSLHKNSKPNKLEQTSTSASKSATKEAFQVKSGIWADSLSRGLIDLNITAPKKVNLADIGIVGGLSDDSNDMEKGLFAPSNAGRVMGTGTGLGRSGYSTSTAAAPSGSFSILGQDQFGSLK